MRIEIDPLKKYENYEETETIVENEDALVSPGSDIEMEDIKPIKEDIITEIKRKIKSRKEKKDLLENIKSEELEEAIIEIDTEDMENNQFISLGSDAIMDDIKPVKEGILKRIKNKKTKEKVKEDSVEDIKPVKKEKFSKLKEKIEAKKAKKEETKDIKPVKESLLKKIKNKLPKKKEKPAKKERFTKIKNFFNKLKTKRNEKIEKAEYNNFDLFVAGFSRVFFGAVSFASLTASLVVLFSSSFAVLPTIAMTALLLAGAKFANDASQKFKDEYKEIKEEKTPEVANNKLSLNNISLNKINKKVEIKDCRFKYEKGLGIYYISVPKENKNANSFVKAEIKEMYPEQKIQTFETEKSKVYVITRK